MVNVTHIYIYISGWWCTVNPSEKWWFVLVNGKDYSIPFLWWKIMALCSSHHQPDMECSLVIFTHQSMVSYGVILWSFLSPWWPSHKHLISGILVPRNSLVKLQQPPFCSLEPSTLGQGSGKNHGISLIGSDGEKHAPIPKTWDPLGISSVYIYIYIMGYIMGY